MSDMMNPHPEDEMDEGDDWQDWIDDAYERADSRNYFFRYWEYE